MSTLKSYILLLNPLLIFMCKLYSLIAAVSGAVVECRVKQTVVSILTRGGVQTETASGHPGWLVDGPNPELALKVWHWRGVAGTDREKKKRKKKCLDYKAHDYMIKMFNSFCAFPPNNLLSSIDITFSFCACMRQLPHRGVVIKHEYYDSEAQSFV